jgi:hypothetical protein
MTDEDSNWIRLDAAVAHVEAMQKCYREMAFDLVKQAVKNGNLRSRTVNSSPRWIVSKNMAGADRYYSDHGERVEVYRKDVLELWPEHQNDATRPAPPEIGSNATQKRSKPISDAIRLAINDLWHGEIPAGLRAKERDNQILDWLKRNGKSIPENISRAVQRVLKADREAHK